MDRLEDALQLEEETLEFNRRLLPPDQTRDVYSSINSLSFGTRLKVCIDLAFVTLTIVIRVPLPENALATAISVVVNDG